LVDPATTLQKIFVLTLRSVRPVHQTAAMNGKFTKTVPLPIPGALLLVWHNVSTTLQLPHTGDSVRQQRVGVEY